MDCLFKCRVSCVGYLLYMCTYGGDRVFSENTVLHVEFSFQTSFVWDSGACVCQGGGEGVEGRWKVSICLYLGGITMVRLGL